MPGDCQELKLSGALHGKMEISEIHHLSSLQTTVLFCRTMRVTEVLTQGPDPGSGVSQHHGEVSYDTVQSVNTSYCSLQSLDRCVGAAGYSFYNNLL